VDLNLARIHYPVTVLGPGRRIGVWFQGCTIGCSGCMSRDTWDPDAGDSIDTSRLCQLILDAAAAERLDGVTLSGGEPFQQPVALRELLVALRDRWPAVDVLAYSGYPLARLQREHPGILRLLDAVIAEPFMRGRATDLPWRGSANQSLTLLSPAAVGRYEDATASPRRLQVGADDESLWVVGIPRRGDLERMRRTLADKGLTLEGVSWTT
jgi:anaerobic ribonucleoside-triphosphate reductase activating protein